MAVIDLLLRNVAQTPDKPAVIAADGELWRGDMLHTGDVGYIDAANTWPTTNVRGMWSLSTSCPKTPWPRSSRTSCAIATVGC